MLTLEDLGIGGLKIYQDDKLYRFTSDAVRLSEFAKVKRGDDVADLCSGSGIVGLHLYALNKEAIKSVTFFEMQTPLYELSLKTIEYNGLEKKISAVNKRLQDIDKNFYGKFSLVVCNPPYMRADSGEHDADPSVAACKREIYLSLEELVLAASRVLKFGGRACIVHRADRLVDLFSIMRRYNLEPKRLQLVCAAEKEPYLFMTEGVKGGKSGLKILKNINN